MKDIYCLRYCLVQYWDNVLSVDHSVRYQLERVLNLPSEPDEPIILEKTESTCTDPSICTLDTDNADCETPPKFDLTHKGLQDVSYEPVLLKHGSRPTRNQLLNRYQHFVLQQSNILSSAFDICIGLCVCLNILFYVYSILRIQCEDTLFKSP